MDIKRVDLIQQLVDRHGYTKKAATSIVDDFTNLILENLEEGNTISFTTSVVSIFWNARREAVRTHRPGRRSMSLRTGFPAFTLATKCVWPLSCGREIIKGG